MRHRVYKNIIPEFELTIAWKTTGDFFLIIIQDKFANDTICAVYCI